LISQTSKGEQHLVAKSEDELESVRATKLNDDRDADGEQGADDDKETANNAEDELEESSEEDTAS